jgi:hypothetical protein
LDRSTKPNPNKKPTKPIARRKRAHHKRDAAEAEGGAVLPVQRRRPTKAPSILARSPYFFFSSSDQRMYACSMAEVISPICE